MESCHDVCVELEGLMYNHRAGEQVHRHSVWSLNRFTMVVNLVLVTILQCPCLDRIR